MSKCKRCRRLKRYKNRLKIALALLSANGIEMPEE